MNELIFKTLMDPAGAPAHPAIFLVLGVVTFALHMTAVNVLLGTLGLSIRGAFSADPNWRRLSTSLGLTAKVAVSLAIVLGVAPLLFVQVIYDPFWYVSNVLSAWWALGFLAVLTAAYLAVYRWYGANHTYDAAGNPVPHAPGSAPKGALWLAAAFALLLVCGLVMHGLANQALLPGEWMKWYAPQGTIDPSGTGLNGLNLPRLAFFLSLSLPVTAGWLYGMRRYLLSSGETDYGYIDFIEALAHRTASGGAVLTILTGALWMATLPESMAWFAGSVWMWLGLIPLGYFAAMRFIQKKRVLCIFCNYMAFAMSVIMVVVIAALREALRYGTLLKAAGWNPMDYTVNFDLPSTFIFFATFLVVGGLNIAYLTAVAWRSGRERGPWDAEAAFGRLGRAAGASLAAWIVGYFAVGACVANGLF